MTRRYRDEFGFVPLDVTIAFEGGRISPLSSFNEAVNDVSASFDRNGVFCPPEYARDLYKLKPTHEIILHNVNDYSDVREVRLSDGGAVIQLVAYIFGVRTQFHDWWFDSKIPCKSTHNLIITQSRLNEFMSHAYISWQAWNDEVRKLFINILYMNSRFVSYNWDWEKFTIGYMVLDGCFKCTKLLDGIKSGTHETRINRLCQHYQLREEKDNIERIVELRNQLFHESLWSNSQPCTAPEGDAFGQVYNLHRFNNRLIMAIIGFETDYIKSSWTIFGDFVL